MAENTPPNQIINSPGMAAGPKGRKRGFSTVKPNPSAILRRFNARARQLKEQRINLIRDGSHGNTETFAALLSKSDGQHSRALKKSLQLSKANALIQEAWIDELWKDMEREINALPESVKPGIQKAISKLRFASTLPRKEKNVKSSLPDETLSEYANRLLEEAKTRKSKN